MTGSSLAPPRPSSVPFTLLSARFSASFSPPLFFRRLDTHSVFNPALHKRLFSLLRSPPCHTSISVCILTLPLFALSFFSRFGPSSLAQKRLHILAWMYIPADTRCLCVQLPRSSLVPAVLRRSLVSLYLVPGRAPVALSRFRSFFYLCITAIYLFASPFALRLLSLSLYTHSESLLSYLSICFCWLSYLSLYLVIEYVLLCLSLPLHVIFFVSSLILSFSLSLCCRSFN